MTSKQFSKEIDYRLVDLVESKTLLWDCTSEVYRRTDLKVAAWDEISKQLGPNLTGAMVSNRFKNIKDTFARNLKNMKESKRSGCGTESVHKPKWHMFDRLMFLKKSCVQGTSVSNILSLPSEASAKTTTYCNVSMEDDSISKDIKDLNNYSNEVSQICPLLSDTVDVESDCPSDSVSQQFPNNVVVTTVNETSPPRSASAPASVPCSTSSQSFDAAKPYVTTRKRASEGTLFCKRGVKSKTPSTLMEEAVDVLKQFCSSDTPPGPSSQTVNPSDTAHTLALFIETRLRSLPLEIRKECENEILNVLTKY